MCVIILYEFNFQITLWIFAGIVLKNKFKKILMQLYSVISIKTFYQIKYIKLSIFK